MREIVVPSTEQATEKELYKLGSTHNGCAYPVFYSLQDKKDSRLPIQCFTRQFTVKSLLKRGVQSVLAKVLREFAHLSCKGFKGVCSP